MSEKLNETLGQAAGEVWKVLSQGEALSATRLGEMTGLDRNDVQRALGWLAREGKLSMSRKGRYEFFSLIE